MWFHNQFNPDNQYRVTAKYKDNEQTHDCFKVGEIYYKAINQWAEPKYITKVEKIKQNSGTN